MSKFLPLLTLTMLAFGTQFAVASAQKLGAPSPNPKSEPRGSAIVADSSFENGTPNAFWTETSTNFGTPLCTVVDCGNGTSTAPIRTGTWWAWFGGAEAAETGSLTQTVTIPAATTATLRFGFQAPVCVANVAHFIEARLGATVVWRVDGTSALCGVNNAYTDIAVDISAFAGQTVPLQFFSTTTGGITNFYVDDVQIEVAGVVTSNIAIGNATTTEGDSGSLPMTFPITVTPASAVPITLTVNTANGTATAGADYTAITGGSFTIPANTTNIDLDVTVLNDLIVETDETFTVTISNASSGTIVTSQALGTIVDNDSAELNLAPIAQAEGNAGNTPMVFTATLSRPVQGTVTANFATNDLTALVGDNDYVAANGTLTFNSGVTTQTITVQIVGDTKVETDERFTLGLTNLTRPPGITAVNLGPNANVEGTIQNDDTSTLTLANATLVEGNSGSAPMNFVLTSSNASAIPLTVNASTTNGSATAPSDFVALVNQTVTVPPGAAGQTVTIPVTINGDVLVEGNESFTLTLSSPSAGAAVGGGPATGTISNDDTTTLSINNVSVTEGNAGTTPATFTVTLSAPVDRNVSFTATTSDGTANAPADYVPLTAQSFSIAAGATSTSVTVNVVGDNIVENDETFFVTPASFVAAPPSGNQVPLDPAVLILPANTRGTGTIVNDDFTQISIGDVSRLEGTAPGGLNPFRFPVTMTNPSQLPVTVQFTTVDGTATAPSDFVATSGTLTLAPGTQAGEIVVNVVTDDVFEPDESFRVRLSNPTPAQASIARAEGVGTILNDDIVPIPVNDPRALALLMLLALGAGLIVLRRH